MGFSQSIFAASEGDGLAQICAELLEGELGTGISLVVDVLDLGNNTGMSFSEILCIVPLISWSLCTYLFYYNHQVLVFVCTPKAISFRPIVLKSRCICIVVRLHYLTTKVTHFYLSSYYW